MPNAKAHQFAGLLVAALFLCLCYALTVLPLWQPIGQHLVFKVTLTDIAILAGLALFFSILPDIDIGTSKAHQYLTFGACLLICLCFLWDLPHLGIVTTLLLLFMNALHHRGITHSLLAAVILVVPIFLAFGLVFAGTAFVAYMSHLLIDRKVKLL